MKKIVFRLILISGALMGIAYLKKDKLLDALIQHSIDVDQIDETVDNLVEKANTVIKKSEDIRPVIKNSSNILSNLADDIENYSNKTQPIINNLRQNIQEK